MKRDDLLQRIWIDPVRCGGRPCIRGHRILVSLVLDLLASGASAGEILADYPGLTREDIQACIAYGSEMVHERFVDIPHERPRALIQRKATTRLAALGGKDCRAAAAPRRKPAVRR